MSKEENKKRIYITLGVVLFIFGFSLLTSNYFNSKVLKAYNYMNLQLLELDTVDVLELDENEILEETEIKEEIKKEEKPINYYIARLSIPKINLEQGLVAMNSKENNVHKNIQIVKGSDYPDKKNGNLVLASHSGTNAVSYFRYLYKVKIGDKCSVSYKGKNYTYKVVDIYTKPKIGKIAIYRDYNKTTLTLITCTKGSNTLQTVYIAELVSVK